MLYDLLKGGGQLESLSAGDCGKDGNPQSHIM